MLDPAGLPKALRGKELVIRVMDRQGLGKSVTVKKTVAVKKDPS